MAGSIDSSAVETAPMVANVRGIGTTLRAGRMEDASEPSFATVPPLTLLLLRMEMPA